MKKLYKCFLPVTVWVFAESFEDAEQVASDNLNDATEVYDPADFTVSELLSDRGTERLHNMKPFGDSGVSNIKTVGDYLKSKRLG